MKAFHKGPVAGIVGPVIITTLVQVSAGVAQAADAQAQADQFCQGWDEQEYPRQLIMCQGAIGSCLDPRVSGDEVAYKKCMDNSSRMLPPGTDWREIRPVESTADTEQTHGVYSGGMLHCDPGYYKHGDECLALPEREGGSWSRSDLYCTDGYIKYAEREGTGLAPDEQRCVKLPAIANGKYRGSSPSCNDGYIMLNGPRCVLDREVRDQSEIIYGGSVNNLGERFFCAERYRYDTGTCIKTGIAGKSLVVADMKLQGLALGMNEKEMAQILAEQGYSLVTQSAYGSSYSKTTPEGTKKTVMYEVAVPTATEEQYRLATHLSFGQAFPTSVRFDLEDVYQDLQNKFGQADRRSIDPAREFSLWYYDAGGKDSSLPMLKVAGTVTERYGVRNGYLTMDTFWKALSDRLNQEYRDYLQSQEESREQQKSKANIEY